MKSMINKRKVIIYLVCTLLLGFLLRPYPTLDSNRIHPDLRDVKVEDKCELSTYGDGGSLAIRITCKNGKRIDMCITKSLDLPRSEKGKMYIGASYYTRKGATKIIGYEHTKFLIAKMLIRNAHGDSDILEDVAFLTGRFPDKLRLWINLVSDWRRRK